MKFFALFSLLLFVTAARAEFQVPTLTGPVMDTVGAMDRSDRQELTQLLYDYNEQGKAQITVLIVPDLQGLTIEEASIKITDQWKLGEKKRDNGILFLIATNEHRMRIEVGAGLEGTLPDITAKQIIADTVTPLFRANRMSDGIVVGTQEIIRAVDKEYADQKMPERKVKTEGNNGTVLLIVLFLIIIFLNRIFRGGGRGGGGGTGFLLGTMLGGGFGGGGGGSSWSGGGGGFNGGGASGSW